MSNLEWLEKMKKDIPLYLTEVEEINYKIANKIPIVKLDYRKVKALEIIAEELIKHNENSGCIITALENIDTTLNRR